jgi:predicted kinase
MNTQTFTMSKFPVWFQEFFAAVEASEIGQQMKQTVEGSEWHREESVWAHTQMCVDHYWQHTAPHRTERQQALTLVCLAAHDFGKPEAEEKLTREDGTPYHRYAGHEPVSANEFVSFMCEQHDLRQKFFDQGFGWDDVRKIKFMIENHLPFGLKNETKRRNLRRAVVETLGDDEQCFYDQLWSDCNGRISDNHDDKRAAVVKWIEEFQAVVPSPKVVPKSDKVMFVLCGPVGVGKSTWVQETMPHAVVVSEDNYRQEFFSLSLRSDDRVRWIDNDDQKTFYAAAWQYCFDHKKDYESYAKQALERAVKSGKTVVIDRTNQSRKSRRPWIEAGRREGYKVVAVEFYTDLATSLARQKSRPDKDVPPNRVRQIFMAMEVVWVGVEVDGYIIAPRT